MDKRTLTLATAFIFLVILPWIVRPAPSPPGGMLDLTPLLKGYGVYADNSFHVIGVEGTSMEPTFGTGDLLLWVPCGFENISLGDVVIYTYTSTVGEERGKTRVYVHRVIEKGENWLYTRGDNMPSPDPYRVTNLLGKVVACFFTSSGGWGK